MKIFKTRVTTPSSSTVFRKSSRGNLREDELKGFRELAGVMLGYDEAALAKALVSGAIVEVKHHDEDLSK